MRRESSRFYELVALGLASYAHASFRIRAVGVPIALDPGGLIVSSHRSDADVPLFVATAYQGLHGRRRRNRAIPLISGILRSVIRSANRPGA